MLEESPEPLVLRDVAPDLCRRDDYHHAVGIDDVAEVTRERVGVGARAAFRHSEEFATVRVAELKPVLRRPHDDVVGHESAAVAELPAAIVLNPAVAVAVRAVHDAQRA